MAVTLGQVVGLYVEKKSGTTWNTAATIRAQRSTIMTFLREVIDIFGTDPDTEDVEDRLVMRAIGKRWPNNGETTTHWQNHARVKTFFNWALKKGYRFGEIDAFLGQKPTKPDIEKKFATREEANRAVAVLTARGDYRRARLVEWDFESHRRPREIFRMKVGDVDLKPRHDAPFGVYYFRESKSGKGRVRIDMTESEARILSQWLDEYATLMDVEKCDDDWYLFPATHSAGYKPGRQPAGTFIIPTREVSDVSYVFREIWKEAGAYVKGKGGHAGRRGGMEEVYDIMERSGVADPLALIMERSKHTSRQAAAGYLNRREQTRRSNEAYRRLNREQGTMAPVRGNAPMMEEAPIQAETSHSEGGQVISFADKLRSRRSAG